MSKFKRYDDEFKKSLVDLHIAGKTQSDLCRDYGVSGSSLSKWVKQFSEVKLEDNSPNCKMKLATSGKKFSH